MSTRLKLSMIALLGLVTVLPSSVCAGLSKTIEVQLSDGQTLAMVEPSDLQGLTWEATKNHLPAVFLATTKSGEGGVSQLFTTARVLGGLYTAEYEKVAGLTGDGADLGKAEEVISQVKAGERGDEVKRKFLEAEAVILWRCMLEDYVRDNKLKLKASYSPNSDPVFLDYYADMLGQANNDVYVAVFQDIAAKNPKVISSYLATADARRASAVAAAVQGHLNIPQD